MTQRIVAFVDHEVGLRLLARMLALPSPAPIEVVAVVTTRENGSQWWPGVAPLCEKARVALHRYGDPAADYQALPDIDWYLLCSWKHVLAPAEIAQPRRGVINLHYSLLPELRGVYPVNQAIIEGRPFTGVTYHLATERIDAGDTVVQGRLAIRAGDTARSLQRRLDDLAVSLFEPLLAWIDDDAPPPPPPGARTGSYRSRADFQALCELDLDKTMTGWQWFNLLRGMSFLPQSRNLYVTDPATGRRVYLHLELSADDDSPHDTGGTGKAGPRTDPF
ncbi:MAG: formyltransferase family protein [Burkholderiaceae bacterium]